MQAPHLFLAHSGLKWMVKQIFPPRYILAVLPSSSGSSISGATAGQAHTVQPTHVSQCSHAFAVMHAMVCLQCCTSVLRNRAELGG